MVTRFVRRLSFYFNFSVKSIPIPQRTEVKTSVATSEVTEEKKVTEEEKPEKKKEKKPKKEKTPTKNCKF